VALPALLSAAAVLVHHPPKIVGTHIRSGLNSIAILAAVWQDLSEIWRSKDETTGAPGN
jgi:hypothetical protein